VNKSNTIDCHEYAKKSGIICKDDMNIWDSISGEDKNWSNEMGEDDAYRNDTISKYDKTKEIPETETIKTEAI
jgi:hypothetical protein